MAKSIFVLLPLAGSLQGANPMKSMIVLKLKWSADMQAILTRSCLKKVFWPNLFVGASFQILEIRQYSSGLKRGPASILNQNPFFEMASKQT